MRHRFLVCSAFVLALIIVVGAPLLLRAQGQQLSKASRLRLRFRVSRARVNVALDSAPVVGGAEVISPKFRPNRLRDGRTVTHGWEPRRKKKEYGDPAAAVCRMLKLLTNRGRRQFTIIAAIMNSSRTRGANLPAAPASL